MIFEAMAMPAAAPAPMAGGFAAPEMAVFAPPPPPPAPAPSLAFNNEAPKTRSNFPESWIWNDLQRGGVRSQMPLNAMSMRTMRGPPVVAFGAAGGGAFFADDARMVMDSPASAPSVQQSLTTAAPKTRSDFPESWIWNDMQRWSRSAFYFVSADGQELMADMAPLPTDVAGHYVPDEAVVAPFGKATIRPSLRTKFPETWLDEGKIWCAKRDK
ncbi:unnamed protein product, partial [Mesorhabditis belari]|uniref:Uncharacterized protein n=1 Tax=Mesorhabditis belari TaxID=2138241 RepID=A0AAF3EXF4_9BILA